MSKALTTTVADSSNLATVAVLSNNIKRQGRGKKISIVVTILLKSCKKSYTEMFSK